MKILVVRDYEEMSRVAGQYVADRIREKPRIVLGLPTGNTPSGMYRYLVEEYRRGSLSFQSVTTFNLDEYLGLSAGHPSSFASFMRENLFAHIDLSLDRTHIPAGDASNVEMACRQYEEMIQQAGGIDVQILGIGKNGHIGFNEPGESFESVTHVTRLTEETREANKSYFGNVEDVPTHAVTMGIQTIMNAREILLLASGGDKSEAVRRAVEGPVDPQVPASVLQLHPNCIWIIDREAANLLSTEVRYYESRK